ncbi:hypothetical protein BGX34_006614 [Mortierella sp. NVP85]|nr:hypothetical protein BGX34_006614 [Mortierella sp. NVP85]
MSHYHKSLYNFAFDRLTMRDNLTKQAEFDVCVALSGIINVRTKDAPDYFDNFCHPDDIPGLRTMLDELDMDKFIDMKEVDYRRLSQQITILKAIDIKENKPTPTREALPIFGGEIPCRATKYQSANIGLGLNIETSKASGGKKLDLQCRGVEELEINNSEAKRCSPSDSTVDQLLQKNLLINHSIMLYLQETIGLQLDLQPD